MYRLSVILLASVGIGLVVVMTVAFLMKKIKETEPKKKRSCADSVRRPSGSSIHVYMPMDVPSQAAVYKCWAVGAAALFTPIMRTQASPENIF